MRNLRFVLLVLTGCGGVGGISDNAGPGEPGGGVSFGGAQDIGEFRSILERGEIPGPSTLDANGFFNEHFNAPPALTCGNTLCLSSGLSVGKDWLTGSYQAALQVAVTTNVDPSQYERLPMNLVIVVDHSGSMSQDGRLEKVKGGLHTLIDNVEDADRIAIVSFDDVVTVDAPFTDTIDRAALHAAVDTLVPRGSTNIYDGLESGLEMLGENPPNERQNRVILLSDGLATAGNTSQEAIIAMATSYITRGIGLTTIGVGNDFDVELMRGLAERGAGNFYFVEDAAAATEVFTDELEYFMSPLAMDLEIVATSSADWTFESVIGTRLWNAGATSGSMQVPAVFLASRVGQEPDPNGGRRGGGSMVFIQLEPHTNRAGKIADLTLSYRLPGSQERITQSITVDYDKDPTELLEEPHLSYPEMAERYAMYNMFVGLRLATEYAVSDWNCAAAALTALRGNASTWGEKYTSDPDIAADLALVDQFLANLGEQGADAATELASCPSADDPYPEGYGGGYQGDHMRGCSTGRSGTGWLALLGVVLIAVRRRRR
jgi:Ca-activated chloride channel homolog